MVKFLDDFHTSETFAKGTNASFIILIPKINNPISLGDFRPIFLVGCMYKIVAKILEKRLQKVLHEVIDYRQNAFLGGRNLLCSVMITNEVDDEAKQKKKRCLVF